MLLLWIVLTRNVTLVDKRAAWQRSEALGLADVVDAKYDCYSQKGERGSPFIHFGIPYFRHESFVH